MRKAPWTIIGAIVTMIGFAVIMVVIFSFTGQTLDSGQKMLVITTIIGLIANAIPSLLSLQKAESVQHAIHDGIVQEKVKEALMEAADVEVVNTQTQEYQDKVDEYRHNHNQDRERRGD